jgi:hypothetical protein
MRTKVEVVGIELGSELVDVGVINKGVQGVDVPKDDRLPASLGPPSITIVQCSAG